MTGHSELRAHAATHFRRKGSHLEIPLLPHARQERPHEVPEVSDVARRQRSQAGRGGPAAAMDRHRNRRCVRAPRSRHDRQSCSKFRSQATLARRRRCERDSSLQGPRALTSCERICFSICSNYCRRLSLRAPRMISDRLGQAPALSRTTTVDLRIS